ncbi:hypothetical protein ACFGVR_08540 [Mucilaginibacter sp. AW1-3]
MIKYFKFCLQFAGSLLLTNAATAQNPFIITQFTSESGAILVIKKSDMPAKVIAELPITRGSDRALTKKILLPVPMVKKDLIVELKGHGIVDVDRLSFK